MPELPEVETVRRDLEEHIKGLSFTGVDVGLPKMVQGVGIDGLRCGVTGSMLLDIGRRGKILLLKLSTGYTLMIHLKMSGQLLYLDPDDPLQKWTHVVFHLSNGNQLRFRDQRQFGYVKLKPTDSLPSDPVLSKLGPEPLDDVFTVDVLRGRLKRRPSGKLKVLLLDQSFIAGIGNIYADEILHYAYLRPTRRARTLSKKDTELLLEGIKRILESAITSRGSSFQQFVDLAGKKGEYVDFHQVYHREGLPCLRNDGGVIKRIKLAGRSTFYCPVCQK